MPYVCPSSQTVIGACETTTHKFPENHTENNPPPATTNTVMRRASEELLRPVLRPTLRRRAASIAHHSHQVHFDHCLEEVRYFHESDKPVQIRNGFFNASSEIERRPNTVQASKKTQEHFSCQKRTLFSRDEFPLQNVHLEEISLGPDDNLLGSVLVRNLSFEKLVSCRFTLDRWATFKDVSAKYSSSCHQRKALENYDRFEFEIDFSTLPNPASRTIILCICFASNGQLYWDNNDNANYEIPLGNRIVKPNKDHMSTKAVSSQTPGSHARRQLEQTSTKDLLVPRNKDRPTVVATRKGNTGKTGLEKQQRTISAECLAPVRPTCWESSLLCSH